MRRAIVAEVFGMKHIRPMIDLDEMELTSTAGLADRIRSGSCNQIDDVVICG